MDHPGSHATPAARARLLLPILIPLGALLMACGHEAPYVSGTAYKPALVVHGMLGAGEAVHRVIVERTRGIEEGYYYGITPVQDAVVTVSDDGVVHSLTAVAGEPGAYAASFSVAPGRRYVLMVREPAGATVHGSTIVPAPPTLVHPATDTTLRFGESLTVLWRSGEGAAGYAIVDAAPGTPENPYRVLFRAARADTTITYSPSIYDGAAHVRIASVDSAFDAYYRSRTGEGGDRRAVRTTLDGGYGVFASYAMSDTRIVSAR